MPSFDAALDDRRMRTLVAVGSTLLPAVPADALAARFEVILGDLPDERIGDDLRLGLGLLGSRAGGLALFGIPVPFAELPGPAREAAMGKMLASRLPQVRQLANGLKRLTCLAALAARSSDPRPALWDTLGYPGPDGAPPSIAKEIVPLQVGEDIKLSCDVVVVGSGAGGGTAAAVLAAAGLDVIVLERGGYYNESDFTHLEADAYRAMYLDGLQNTTADGGVTMLAGATLGGGTVVNYSTSFPTPPRVLHEWDEVSGLAGVFTGREFADSLTAVQDNLAVNQDHNEPSHRDAVMERGLRALGWHVDAMPRNVLGCVPEECGFCTMGCRRSAKQTTLHTYLDAAFSKGARLVLNADVSRVNTAAGVATGVTASVSGHEVTVAARAVVLAAGSLNTPAILLRSGIGGPAVGRFLRLHPATPVWGDFAEVGEPWSGVMQALYSDEFADLDSQGYGFKFETAPIHPVFFGVLNAWESSEQFQATLAGYRRRNVVGILLRDTSEGRVTIDRRGRPVWKYRLNDHDTNHLRVGVARAAEVLAAAGATNVATPQSRLVNWRPASGEPIDEFMLRVDAAGYGPGQFSLGSWHQLGSARMGSDPKTSVVDGNSEAHDTPNLFVLDAATFPTASGVNPMITIKALAHRGASILAARLA